MKKIRYKKENYVVTRSDKIKIRRIKFVLFLKRWKRRVFSFFPKGGGQYIVLLILWIIFGVVFFLIWNIFMDAEISMRQNIVWELIIQFFTSFVLVVAICGYTQVINYRKMIRDQYNMYIDALYAFDNLFNPYLNDELAYYMPFFNTKCLNDTLKYIKQHNLIDIEIDKSGFKEILEDILEQLEEIKNKMIDNAIVGMHRDKLNEYIKDAKKSTKHVVLKIEENKYTYSDLEELAYNLFAVIMDIRWPWRWDIENNCKIYTILSNYKENNIEEDFYNGMHLYGHKFSD